MSRRVLVHPDVIKAATIIIEGLEAIDKQLMAMSTGGYHLGDVVTLCLEDEPVAQIVWYDDAWCVEPSVNEADHGRAGVTGTTP